MTEFGKVIQYYDALDEWGRMNTYEGQLEYLMSMDILQKYLPEGCEVLDLGGGPGRYTIDLAKMGYQMHLADITQTLLDQARKRIETLEIKNVKSINQVNATDLRCYIDNAFDAVILFGPLYHLTEDSERIACVSEVHRVLKKGGIIIASYIPYIAGATSIVKKMLGSPDEATFYSVELAFDQGVFYNNADTGFQEGYFSTSCELEYLFKRAGFRKLCIRSVQSIGAGMEEKVMRLKAVNEKKFHELIDILHKMSDNPAVIETGTHAVYIGLKS